MKAFNEYADTLRGVAQRKNGDKMDEKTIIHLEEREDVNAARNGDVDAFCRVYEQYRDRLYRYAFYRLGNAQDAEDAVSECVLSAFRQIGQLRDAKAFPAWIFKILAAVCAKTVKAQAEHKKSISLEAVTDRDREEAAAMQVNPAGAGDMQQDPAETVARRMDLLRALDQLGEDEKEIVLLSVIAGFTSAEIAQMTGNRPGTVRSKQSRSLAKMRACLEG